SDGKVVFTAPDASPIHCLNVKDGLLIWKAAKEQGDLYLAGVLGDKVLIVGMESCRALRLRDGQQAWSLATGVLSAYGVAGDDHYSLPLASAAGTKQPEVCVIDVAKGRIAAHARSPKTPTGKPEVPGNLLFFEDRLLSQTATRMVAYPLLAGK